jgi:arylsulfatase A-like enzyme/Tfp pilus assembly protein PilF
MLFTRLRIALVLATVIAQAAALPSRGADPPPAASLLLITLDTTRADRIGCYGADDAATPHLDALAATGVRFDNALSPVPLTLPTHATLMTGVVPRRHGVRNNALHRLDGELPVLAESLKRAGYRTAAFVSAAVLDRITGIGRGFDVYDDSVRVGDRAAFNYQERAASQTTDAVLRALGDLEPPFFLWVHYFDPHLPYVAPEPYRTRFAGRPYDGEIAFMDGQLGRLVDAVRARHGKLVIAAVGDHGESLGDHGEDAHGVFLYQSTQRVPLILNGPGVPRGRSVAGNVGVVDLAPTLLDLLGLPPLPDVDGRSLVGVMKPGGEPRAKDDGPGYEMESFFPRFAYGWSPLRAWVRGTHKYIEAPAPELYDLSADPGERRNLLETRPEIAAGLARQLEERIGDDDPGAPQPDPELAAQRERLESLGYVGGSSGGGDTAVDPKDAIGWVRELDAARRELKLGDPRRAIAMLRSLLEKNPESVPAWLSLVQGYLSTGNAAAAIEAAGRALERSPDDDLVHFNLANALAANLERDPGALAKARRSYERAHELNPRNAEVYLNHAALLIVHVSPDSALKLLGRARDAGVRDPDIELEIGLLELKRGAAGPARAAFERALELNPCAEGIEEALGRMAAKDGRVAEAAERFERALACRPPPAVAARLRRALEQLER